MFSTGRRLFSELLVENTLQAIVTMISLVNPLVCLAMFNNIEHGQSPSTQKSHAFRVSLTTLVILASTALVGTAVLSIFGISIDAFSVTGGAVLLGIGAAMLGGHQTPTNSSPSSESPPSLSSLILFSAGPGPITGVITLAAQDERTIPFGALIAVSVTCVLLWITLFFASRKSSGAPDSSESTPEESPSQSFSRDIATRFMGLIIIAMGVQIGLSGLKGFFAPTG